MGSQFQIFARTMKHPLKFRTVRFDKIGLLHQCSCRKTVWHGIVSCHLIAVFRRMNVLACPIELFNRRWYRDFTTFATQTTARAERLLTGIDVEAVPIQERERCSQRVSELSSIVKDCITRCIYDDTNFELVKSSFNTIQNQASTQFKGLSMHPQMYSRCFLRDCRRNMCSIR